MPFKEGDIVTIKRFKRDGVILAVLADAQYRVSLGNLPVTVAESELSPAKGAARVKPKTDPGVTVQSTARQGSESEVIDLHGMTAAEAVAELETKLNRAILAKLHRIKVVHGLGSGRLREAVHRYLGESTLIASYKVDEFNPGVTWVYL